MFSRRMVAKNVDDLIYGENNNLEENEFKKPKDKGFDLDKKIC